MVHSTRSHLLSWLLLPAAGLVLASAARLPHQSYTGLSARGDVIEDVTPGSPAARGGILPGDRFAPPPGVRVIPDPLARAAPGRPLALTLERGGTRFRVWIAPEPLSPQDWSTRVGELVVAAGFVLLAGWVWSERRDRLTRTFVLLCLAFAVVLVQPLVQWSDPRMVVTRDFAGSLATAFLPVLFVHFFALFPESRGPSGPGASLVGLAHGFASLLFAASAAVFVVRLVRPEVAQQAFEGLTAVASAWFLVGVLSALVLFARSFARAGSHDARRRLRVVLAGTVLGAAPVAALVAIRNLAPGTSLPGEQWAVPLLLLMPASFAWAIAVHRIFDFRLVLGAGLGAALVVAAAGAAWLAGERLAARTRPEIPEGAAGAGAALLVVALGIAGPARRRLRAAVGGAAVERTLAEWTGPQRVAHDRPDQVLASACETLLRALRLDGCSVLVPSRDRTRVAAGTGRPTAAPLERLPDGLSAGRVLSVDDAPLEPADREALAEAGARWLLPVGEAPPQALFVLGRRLAGSWLDLEETAELRRFSGRIELALENVTLRRDASSLGRLDRSLREAGAIQAHRLPRHAPVFPTLDCAAAALSSEPVGGDYYDFVEGPSRDFTLAVGDAAGKGVPAALVLADVQARFRAEVRRGQGPAEVLATLNHELLRHDEPEHFVGLLCARVEAREGRVRLANAGITPPLLRRRDGGFEELSTGGVLLGVREGSDYPDVTVVLGAGDLLVIHTDGLTEARRGEEMFGVERVRRVLDAHAHRRAADIVQALVDAVRGFADDSLDDLTVLVLRQLTDPPGPPARREVGLKSTSVPADTDR